MTSFSEVVGDAQLNRQNGSAWILFSSGQWLTVWAEAAVTPGAYPEHPVLEYHNGWIFVDRSGARQALWAE